MFSTIFGAFDRYAKCPLLQESHLLSDLQGQNPGKVELFCCRLCFEEWCILSPFSVFKRLPHSGHWFVFGCDSLSFSGTLRSGSRMHMEISWKNINISPESLSLVLSQ